MLLREEDASQVKLSILYSYRSLSLTVSITVQDWGSIQWYQMLQLHRLKRMRLRCQICCIETAHPHTPTIGWVRRQAGNVLLAVIPLFRWSDSKIESSTYILHQPLIKKRDRQSIHLLYLLTSPELRSTRSQPKRKKYPTTSIRQSTGMQIVLIKCCGV